MISPAIQQTMKTIRVNLLNDRMSPYKGRVGPRNKPTKVSRCVEAASEQGKAVV